MIFNLIDKAIILGHKKCHSENVNIVKSILQNNDYPLYFINKYIKQRILQLKYNNSSNSQSLVLNYL